MFLLQQLLMTVSATFLFHDHVQPADNGPIYHETDPSHLIVEPWNAVSAFFFILIVFYWAFRLRGTFKTHTFMNICLPILAIGSVGGTIYHALRLHIFFMYMDWVPILMLCLMASLYFFIRIFGSWKRATAIVMVFTAIQVMLFQFLSPRVAINTSYALLVVFILTPLFWWLKMQNFRYAGYVWTALGCFSIALFCRIADKWGILPMGTHFLWHTFGALACHYLLFYVYRLNAVPNPRNKVASLNEDGETVSVQYNRKDN